MRRLRKPRPARQPTPMPINRGRSRICARAAATARSSSRPRARRLCAYRSRQLNQDRHVTTAIAASRCPSTGRGGARSDGQFEPQFDQSSSFKVARFDRSQTIIQRNDLEQRAASSRRIAAASSAALKSPSRKRRAHSSLPAVSSLGGLRTPAPGVRRAPPSLAGIRKPSQQQTSPVTRTLREAAN
jgi:hypothetical protein